MLFPLISSVFTVIGIALLFKFTPEQITEDLMKIISPHGSIREKAKNIRGGREKHKLYSKLLKFRNALEATGKSKRFSFVCFASLILFAVGIVVSVLIDNLFLMPVIALVFALMPFLYTSKMLSDYDKHTKEELETTLSIITTSYIRNDDILKSVSENIEYIKPPLKEIFKSFEGDATAVMTDVRQAILNLRGKVDDEIFREWCSTLVQCQDDRSLKDALQPIVAKLSDVRIVNSELKTMLSSARNEYWTMVALLAGNVPLLYFLNKDWFNTLVFSTQGKVMLGICGAVIFITALFCFKFTKPIEYKR